MRLRYHNVYASVNENSNNRSLDTRRLFEHIVTHE